MSLMSGSSGPSASTSPKALAPQARLAFQDAFNKFKQTVLKSSIEDSHNFQSTSLEDVRNAAKEVERQLAARQCLRNMRRIQPFLDGLERYSKVIEVLCNGTPYLPWIWAPVKLMLQLAADFTAAFEKLISAYGQIAENLPRFDRLSDTFSDNPEFQQVLAIVYADILEFHHSAYKFFRRRGWKCFFSSSWGRFDARFKCILESLAKHTDMVDREANAVAIAEAKEWRQRAIQATAKREMEQSAAQVQSVISWLGSIATKQDQQDDLLDRLLCSCYPETSEWIVRNSKIRAWSKDQPTQPLLWLKGKPGSGKSILCSKIIQFLRQDRQSTVLFHFCSYLSADSTQSALVLKSLTAQLLRHNRDFSSYIYDEFILKGLTPSVQNLKQILANILSSVKGPRIIIDGVDECEDAEQKVMLRDILPYASGDVLGVTCKILIASRDVRYINAVLSKRPTLSLNDESVAIDSAIKLFVHQRLGEMSEKFKDLEADQGLMADIEKDIVTKSEGMFLWVRLVLDVLEDDVYNIRELKCAVRDLPTGLKEFYKRILDRVRNLSPHSFDKAIRILEWIAFARRPLRRFEIQNALAFPTASNTPSEVDKLSETVLHLCKPLIEDAPNGIVTFVHFSVHEYLMHKSSGPFMQKPEAEYRLTLACAAYLRFSITLIDAEFSEEERTIRVSKGLHGIHLYAHEYWLDHLLSYIQASRGFKAENSNILHSHLNCLVAAQQQYRTPIADAIDVTPSSNNMSLEFDKRLAGLVDHPGVFRMASELLMFRDCQLKKQADFDVEYAPPQVKDPTVFTDVLYSYNTRVHLLLSCENFPGLTKDQLDTFKSTYGPTAFACRFSGCVQSTVGFATDRLRGQHEQTHAPRLTCNNLNCNYGLSFSSPMALKRHVKEYHNESQPRVPQSVLKHYQSQQTQNVLDNYQSQQAQNVLNNVLNHYRSQQTPRGWQQLCRPEERALIAQQLSTSFRLAKPDVSDRDALNWAVNVENERFSHTASKEDYNTTIKERMYALQQIWQKNADLLQQGNNHVGQQMGMMGQANMQNPRPNQGQPFSQNFPNPQLQRPMQVSPLPMSQGQSSTGINASNKMAHQQLQSAPQIAQLRTAWVTVDASPDKRFLANCKQCRSGKQYDAYYNAAAHLRRAHFHPRGRKGKRDETRRGQGGGDDPPMDVLKQFWMKEVEIVAPTGDAISEQITSANPKSSTYLDSSANNFDRNRSYLAPFPSHQANDFMMNDLNDRLSFDMPYGIN